MGPGGPGEVLARGQPFYEGLPRERKRRLHFHDFFRRLHDGVTGLGARNDGQSALDWLIGDSRILIFDEFHAHDAGHAMLIARPFRICSTAGSPWSPPRTTRPPG